MGQFLVRWLVSAAAVYACVFALGWEVANPATLLAWAALLGLAHALVRPILLELGAPWILVSMMLAMLALNLAFFLSARDSFTGTSANGLPQALLTSLAVSVIAWIVSAGFRGSDGRFYWITHHLERSAAAKSLERGSR